MTDRALPGLPMVLAVGASVGVLVGGVMTAAVALVPDDALAPVPTATVTEYVPKPGPTVTKEVPVPGPTVTKKVTVTRTAEPASRSSRLNSSDEAFLRCVVERESGGDPKAQNRYSSASGLFQFIDGTWRAYSKESGIGRAYARAKDAPASTQWALARWVVDHKGRYPWKPTVPGTGC